MNVSHAAAGRARSVDSGVFFSKKVRRGTEDEPALHPPIPPYAWKRTLEDRVWSTEGPRGVSARAVLVTLVRHADANGRTWMGMSTIAAKAGIGSLRTVRNALEALVKQGWLHVLPQTWASLTAEQTSAGRPAPRRDDVGQAPNLYVVLDGRGTPPTPPATEASPTPPRPGLARIAAQPRHTPVQNGQGGPGQNGQGGALADLHGDLDPIGSGSRIESAERDSRVGQRTHEFPKSYGAENPAWREAWNILVTAHADRTKAAFGLAPFKPDVRGEQQQAMAECLVDAAAQVCTKLQQRSNTERIEVELQRELAECVMRLYFKHDSEHLKRVKWALRDLHRELHARLVEAMQMLLRESHETTPTPRVAQDKPVQVARFNSVEPQVLPLMNNAREAQRIIEMLAGPSVQEMPCRRREERVAQAVKRTKPTLPDWFVAELERERCR